MTTNRGTGGYGAVLLHSKKRAEVSRVCWQYTYNFGDFHGSEDTLLK
jgi:hypothetical protein